MSQPGASDDLVGRAALQAHLRRLAGRVGAGQRTTVLVAGEAGIGKTSLLRDLVAAASGLRMRTAWGTCLDVEGAPGYWPWTQALDGLVRAVGVDRVRTAIGDDAALLAPVVPSLAGAPDPGPVSERNRLLAMDATARLLDALADAEPLLVVIDDLQWADESSLALFDFLARVPRAGRVGLIGAYRHDELPPGAARWLGELVSRSEHVQVGGVDADAVGQLVERVAGEPVDRATAAAVHRRTGGHPFFVRELALLTRAGGTAAELPAAVRDAINRRVAALPEATIAVLETAAVAGAVLLPDVVAAALGWPVAQVEAGMRAAVTAGVLVRTGDGIRFRHDLLRETLLDRVDAARRGPLHRALGAALESRSGRGGQVAPAEIARHFIAAVGLDGPERAVHWALRAAANDSATLAFAEAAGHLRRLRAAVADAAVDIDDRQLTDVLLAEADALARTGSTVDARGLLRRATDLAAGTRDPERIARVALAGAQLGARFAARRDEIVHELDRALAVVAGVDAVWEARLTATLARELQHSVAEDRPRARPLSERALELGHRTGDAPTLLTCLLARHDVLWTPGTGPQRAAVAREIVAVAQAAGDQERHADGLLLLATALLEQGSLAFAAALESAVALLSDRGQPRHRYLALTRRACLALLRGRLADAEKLVEEAAALGERIREPDTENVRMSQRLELVRARADPDELRAFAGAAVEHWTGAPVHAHAVAAGFSARAGALDDAARHAAAVLDLGTWRADDSYLRSVFVRELAHAAVALDDRPLCVELFDYLHPLAGSCAVNGAMVAFAGSHAHTAGLLAAALERPEESRLLLDRATATYRRLGAADWLAEASGHPGRPEAGASMRCRGPVWHLGFAGRTATVPHSKGIADLARLLAAPGTEVHVLELAGSADRSGGSGEVVDRSALAAYRRRLAELDAELDDAAGTDDPTRRARGEAERRALIDELGRVTGTRRQPRQFANHPAERARKAVSGRIRDAIRKLHPVLPELAVHLERAVVTGTYCRYRPDGTVWTIES